MSAKKTPKTPKTETAVIPAVDVAKLVEQVKAAHAATVSAYRKSLDNAKRAGKLLKELKAHIDAPDSPYSWAKWVEPNTGISERTANNYMRVYEGWDKIDAAIKAGADSLTMTGALALLKGEGKGGGGKKPLTKTTIQAKLAEHGIGCTVEQFLALLDAIGIKPKLADEEGQSGELVIIGGEPA